jgi:hypothetical protein
MRERERERGGQRYQRQRGSERAVPEAVREEDSYAGESAAPVTVSERGTGDGDSKGESHQLKGGR